MMLLQPGSSKAAKLWHDVDNPSSRGDQIFSAFVFGFRSFALTKPGRYYEEFCTAMPSLALRCLIRSCVKQDLII